MAPDWDMPDLRETRLTRALHNLFHKIFPAHPPCDSSWWDPVGLLLTSASGAWKWRIAVCLTPLSETGPYKTSGFPKYEVTQVTAATAADHDYFDVSRICWGVTMCKPLEQGFPSEVRGLDPTVVELDVPCALFRPCRLFREEMHLECHLI
jgi:hypothetical protein